MMALPQIYLASQSPRRQQLLTQMGISFETLLPVDPEAAEALEAVWETDTPRVYVKRVCLLKLNAAVAHLKRTPHPQRPVLTADTTVAFQGKVFGKPRDAGDAFNMLRALSGKTHEVLTAVALGDNKRRLCTVHRSSVTFAEMTDTEIESYVSTGEPLGKAGAYAIQGLAAMFVKKITGSHSGIMGLPVYETRQLLLDWMKD